MEGHKVRDIVFEDEFVYVPATTINNDQAPIPNIVQNANPEYQDNVEELPVQKEEIIHKVQTQQPQKNMPLKRSTRERRSAILDDYVVFLIGVKKCKDLKCVRNKITI